MNVHVLYVSYLYVSYGIEFWDRGQHLERPNLKRLIFRNFEISNFKINKVKLFDFIFLNLFFTFTFVQSFRTLKIHIW